MTFKFFPHTDEEEFSMLHKIGAKYREDLFVDIPEALKNALLQIRNKGDK